MGGATMGGAPMGGAPMGQGMMQPPMGQGMMQPPMAMMQAPTGQGMMQPPMQQGGAFANPAGACVNPENVSPPDAPPPFHGELSGRLCSLSGS